MKRVSLILFSLLLLAGCPAPNDATGTPSNTETPSNATENEGETAGETASGDTVAFSVAQNIINARCLACHAAAPTQPGFNSPAAGVTFDTPDEIKAKAARIKVRAVDTKGMPQGNATQMTEDERETLGKWIEQGANLE